MPRVRVGLGTKILIGLVVLFVLYLPSPLFGYVLHGVKSNEIGVKLRSNSVIGAVGPGIYKDLRPFADIVDIKTEGLDFCVEDKEVLIKKAEQRIGVMVCGRVRRPGVGFDYKSNWAQYRSLYVNDVSVVGPSDPTTSTTRSGIVFAVTSQAMKVCVGDRSFEESVVGSARDDLRECMDTEMSKLAEGYGGMIVDNVTVPNVGLSRAARIKMDQITDAKLQADLSRKEADKAAAEGEHQLAVEQASIKVAQGKIQEDQRQRAITADLERLALEAQTAVIEATKANEFTAAQRDLEIQRARKLAAVEQALADLAHLSAEADIYSRNPRYASLVVSRAYAEAYKGGEKMIVDAGTDIRAFLGAQSVMPLLNMDGTQVPQ